MCSRIVVGSSVFVFIFVFVLVFVFVLQFSVVEDSCWISMIMGTDGLCAVLTLGPANATAPGEFNLEIWVSA